MSASPCATCITRRGLAVFAANLQPTGSSIHHLPRGVASRHLWAKLTT
jgi:hypothetical protein